MKPRTKGKDDNKLKSVKELVKEIEKKKLNDAKEKKTVKRRDVSLSPKDKKNKKLEKNESKRSPNRSPEVKATKGEIRGQTGNIGDKIDMNDKNDKKKSIDKNNACKDSPIIVNKIKNIISAFEENVAICAEKQPNLKSADNTIKKLKECDDARDAFVVLMESVQGGTMSTSSPGRIKRKRIGSLKSIEKQRSIEDWFGKSKINSKK